MKKMANRVLSVILALIMVMSMLVVTVSADGNNAEFSISVSGNVAVGEEITVLIAVENAKAVNSATIDISYDSECIDFIGIKAEDSHDYICIVDNFSDELCRSASIFSGKFSGTFTVAVLTLKIVDLKNTDITLSATQWSSEEASPVDAVFSLNAVESDNSTITNLYYKYKIENGEVTITDCDLDIAGEVIIPDTIEGYPVTAIGENAFANCSRITSIVIPDCVKNIEEFAFSSCNGLVNATIGAGVTTLGQNIFWSCQKLENVVIKEGVKYISREMFSQCQNLRAVSIPQSVTSIGESAFTCCYQLNELSLPKNLTAIENSAFYMCESLKNIVIPNAVTKIGEYAFYQCENLESINIPENVTVINSSTFSGCKELSNIQLHNNITQIGSYAFSGCAIKEINIPDGIKEICEGVFSGCSYLSEVTIPETVDTIGMYAFLGCASLKNITVPLSVENVYYKSLGFVDEMNRLDNFYIHGFEGSAAELYAQSNLINFIAIENDEPTPDEPTPDKPAQDTVSTVLTPNTENITVTDTVADVTAEMSVEDVIKSVENENVQILDKDGKELAKDSFVGTGSKINILDKDGNILSTYEVMVKSDVNGDGKITPADARLALRAAANLDKLDGVYAQAANVDGVGAVTPSDARKILRQSAGLEK